MASSYEVATTKTIIWFSSLGEFPARVDVNQESVQIFFLFATVITEALAKISRNISCGLGWFFPVILQNVLIKENFSTGKNFKKVTI